MVDGQHGKCCVYAKRMFLQNFSIFEKKLARRSAYLVYKGKLWILNEAKPKKMKLTFWAQKSTNIVIEYTKRCGIATFGGVCFLRKVHLINIFMRKS